VPDPYCYCRRLLRIEFLEQRLCLLEVEGVEALGEPAVDRRQEVAGIAAAEIAASIKEWGWTTPALVGEDGGRDRFYNLITKWVSPFAPDTLPPFPSCYAGARGRIGVSRIKDAIGK
jgi:ParB-like chromosome segregation protein Spo0J